MHKYALYAQMYIKLNMPLYANLKMQKYAQNMRKYANVCTKHTTMVSEVCCLSLPVHLYAFICIYMQDM